MAKGRKTGGRQKGTPNKVTRDMREMLREALERLGGVDYLVSQGRGLNSNAFMALLGKTIPKEIDVQADATLTVRWLDPAEEKT